MKDKFLRKVASIVFAGLVFGALAATPYAQAQTANATPSLYKRLGGYDAIAAVSDDFLGRLATDKQMSRFFVGVSADSLRKLRQHGGRPALRGERRPLLLFRSQHENHACGLGDHRVRLATHRQTLDGNF